jgi:two-component system OmpR family sensor kinase
LVVLLIAGLTAAAATLLLRQYLTDEVDHRLRTMSPNLSAAIAPDQMGNYAPPQFIHSRQPPDTIGAIVSDGAIAAAGYNGDSGEERGLDVADARHLATVSVTSAPQTVRLSVGDFRVVSADVDQSTVLLGYSLEPVEAATARLATVAGLLLLFGMLLAVPVLYALVRSALRPLTRLEGAAQKVTAESLATANVDEARAGLASAGPSAEVVRLAQSMDTMLLTVQSSLTERDARTKQLRQFIGDASHELRTPLSIVQGYTEFARRIEAPEPVSELLGRVAEGAGRMHRLVEDMLTLTRIEAGEDIHLEPADVIDLLHGRALDFESRYPEHSWVWFGRDESWSSEVDVYRLTRAFDEVLQNAADYSDEHRQVVVSHEIIDDRAVLTIFNTASAIDPTLPARAFEPFVAGDDSRARTRTGTGLGLAIARAGIRRQGGTIEMRVDQHHVAVTIDLPRSAPTEELSTAQVATSDR